MPRRKNRKRTETRKNLPYNTASAKSGKGFSAVNIGRRNPKGQVGVPEGKERRKGPLSYSIDVPKPFGSGANTFPMTDRRKKQLESGGVRFSRTKKK